MSMSTEGWGVIQQNFGNDTGATWGNDTANRSSNLQAGGSWERAPPSGNWGTDRASAPTPSENNLSPRRNAQAWGPNKSENSWINRNDSVQVDQTTWQTRKEEPAISESGYKKIKRENEEEDLDSLAMQASIENSFNTMRRIDDYIQKPTILDEDDVYDPSYSTPSKQLGKSIVTSYDDDEIQFNTSDVYNNNLVEPPITSSNSTFQEPKRFHDVEVQTDPVDISRLIGSKEKLLSVTIGSQYTGQDLSKSATNNVNEKRFPPQTSLMDMDQEELNTKANSWNPSSGNPNFREGTTAIPPIKPDTNSRSEATQYLPKPNSDSWDNKTTSVQNENWKNSSGDPNFREDTVAIPPIKPDTNSRNEAIQRLPKPNSDWNAAQQMSTRNDNRGPASQSIPQTSARNDNRDTVPQQIPVQSDSWDSPITQIPAQNDRGSAPQPNPNWGAVPPPTQNNSWNSQQPSQPKDTTPQEDPKGSGTVQQRPDNQSVQQAGDTWGASTNNNNDWMKQAELYTKELGNSENKTGQTSNTEQKVENSYGTGASDSYHNNSYNDNSYNSYNSHNDNSSSNNRYGGRTCNTCGQEGHYSRDCPDKKQGYSGGISCHNCGKEGHMLRDCPDEISKGGYGGGGRPCYKCGKEGHIARDCSEESSKGGYGGGRTCRKCGKDGHIARECSEESGYGGYGGHSKSCHKCGKDGHIARDCKEDAYETTGEDGSYGNNSGPPRFSPFSSPEHPNISSQEAWEKVLKADGEQDVDDFVKALELFAKATPDETFVTIEKKLRVANCNGRIIALERTEIPLTKVLVDLQGNPNKKYVARPIMGHPSRLPRTSGNRADSEQENLLWLVDSGFMVDDRNPVCFNCKQKGHITKDCSEPKREIERQSPYTCGHCRSTDHQSKFCPNRGDPYAEARDRKFSGYSANEDRAPSGYDGHSNSNPICYNCKREGHMSRDCTEPKRGGGGGSSGYDGEDDRRSYRGNQVCYNCNGEGHTSRECPEKRTGGRKCNKCGEEGHMSKDCTNSSGGSYDRGNYNNSSSGWQRDSSRNTDKTAPWDNQDNKLNKARSDNTAFGPQENSWKKPSGGDSSRDDYNDHNDYNNTQNKGENNTYSNYSNDNRDSSSTQSKSENTSLQRDNKPVLTSLPVEKDSWDAPLKTENTAGQNDWGYKTAEDFGWEKSSENKKSAPEDYENRQVRDDEQRERTFVDRRGRGDDQSERSYDNRRGYGGRGDEQRERSYDNRRGYGSRGDDQRERSYDNRRGYGGRSDDQRERYDNYDNRRGRGNDQRERSENYDNRRGRGNDQRERSENYDNRRGRGNEQRERTNEKYNNNHDSYSNSSRTRSNDANNPKPNLDEQRPWW